ncbi:MAG: acetyl-CoA carboxylase, carboxyltransferase subunit beta [Candidatus Kapabacteria bacterium]|jgi:acetyl-CoA carboxylase carboxyl transferase subunit beta|nr:acetyl-CoA carboxylase, carboxyltransferase subunit beta [Candidatus Kapabacteria bacterium]
MSWFLRSKANITEETQKAMPDGLWTKCPTCSEIMYKTDMEEGLFTCKKCSYHFRIGSKEYIRIILDEGSFEETNQNIRSKDPLEFTDTKDYPTRIAESYKKTGLNDAITTGTGTLKGRKVSFACMNFSFIGGSMGSVVGEKIYRAAKLALDKKMPFILISASGGARMQESVLSLMQMAKTSAILAELDEAGIPFISILTDPTTGGVTASFAMLGDVNIAEPGALIGFAGPRVIEETIRKKLPVGFQRAEFLLEHGFIDKIINRKVLRDSLSVIVEWFYK